MTRGSPPATSTLDIAACRRGHHASTILSTTASRHGPWPPLTTTGKPRAGKGANPKLLGVERRSDGRLQVTYKGHPLYFYAGGLGPPPDKKPGDVNGQNFAGLWWVVSPRGTEIK